MLSALFPPEARRFVRAEMERGGEDGGGGRRGSGGGRGRGAEADQGAGRRQEAVGDPGAVHSFTSLRNTLSAHFVCFIPL